MHILWTELVVTNFKDGNFGLENTSTYNALVSYLSPIAIIHKFNPKIKFNLES